MSKHKDFLKQLDCNNPNDWKLVSNNILLISDLLTFNLFPPNKLKDIPSHFFNSPVFCLKVFAYYHPPIDKINETFFNDTNFLMEVASKYPYNLKYIPSKYITPDLIDWYINIHSSQKDYTKYIPLDNLSEENGINILENNYKDYLYIFTKFPELSFYEKLSDKIIASIYPNLPLSIQENSNILKRSISLNPAAFNYAPPSFHNNKSFTELITINPLVFKYAPNFLKNDFENALYAITKNISNLEFLDTLKDDLEFFIACHNNLSTQLTPYYQYFSHKIFSDEACVNLILDNLIETNNVSLISEPLSSNKEIMFKAIRFKPENYQYVGEKLIFDVDFFNQIQYYLKEIATKSPTKHIWFEMHQNLIKNIPFDALDNVSFLGNLFRSNQDSFVPHILPIISIQKTPLLEYIKENKIIHTEELSDFFAKFEHQKALEKKIHELNLLKKEKIIKKI